LNLRDPQEKQPAKPEEAKPQHRIIRLELHGAQDKGPRIIILREVDGKWTQVPAPGDNVRWQVVPASPQPPATPKPVLPPGAPLPPGAEPKRVQVPLLVAPGDNRIEQLERKLEGVLKELEALRRDLHRERPGEKKPTTPGATAPTPRGGAKTEPATNRNIGSDY
jgi:hypothetical protein